MMYIKRAVRSAFAVALVGMGLAVTTPARADVEVGMLSCRSLGTTSYIIVSDQPFNCIFTPSAGGPIQYYQATIHLSGPKSASAVMSPWDGPSSRQPHAWDLARWPAYMAAFLPQRP